MAQELIRHNVLSLDFWQDTVTYAGSVMPTGTHVTELPRQCTGNVQERKHGG